MFIFLSGVLSERKKVEVKLNDSRTVLENLLRKRKIKPSRNTILLLKEQKKDITFKYNELLKLIKRSSLNPLIPVPLEFKEELLKTQAQLRERAQLWNITVPRAIGFGEFEGGIIPESDKIPVLIKQLELVKIIINMLIESKINSLDNISKSSSPPESFIGENIIMETFIFEFTLEANYDSLINFMSKLNTSLTFFTVKDINIQKLTDNSLKMHMTINVILFNQTKAGNKKR